jgi:hypothetical protein
METSSKWGPDHPSIAPQHMNNVLNFHDSRFHSHPSIYACDCLPLLRSRLRTVGLKHPFVRCGQPLRPSPNESAALGLFAGVWAWLECGRGVTPRRRGPKGAESSSIPATFFLAELRGRPYLRNPAVMGIVSSKGFMSNMALSLSGTCSALSSL